jgi:hypothetical protein
LLQEAARLDAMLEAYVKKRYETLAKLAGGGPAAEEKPAE